MKPVKAKPHGDSPSVPVPAEASSRPFEARHGKLSPPYFAFDPVIPGTVAALLNAPSRPKLVCVCAPAGYGKTVALSLMHGRCLQRGERALWVSLDDRDQSADGVLAMLAQSLALARAGAPEHRDDIAGWTKQSIRDGSAQADHFLNQLGEAQGATTVFIDNLHFCKDLRLPALLERLLFGSEPSLRLVLSSATSMPIDLMRVKLELGMAELGIKQLSFDRDCTARVFAAAGLSVKSWALLDQIQSRTEGWPAAVRLLLVLCASEGELEQTVARFSGDDGDIAQALTRRVFAGYEPKLVRFLEEIALLREFSPEIAMEVTGETQAAAWTQMLLDRSMLVFPIDRDRRWLRMHTLLRQYLLAEGRVHMDRERRQHILEQAARWHAHHKDFVTAIDLALEAPAMPMALAWVDQCARSVVGEHGRLHLFIGWVEQLMAAGAPVSLEAHAWYVWSLCFTLQHERAQRSMDALDARLAVADLSPHAADSFRKRLGLLRVVSGVYLDSLGSVKVEAAAWLAHSANQDALSIATVATGAAVADLACGELIAARKHMAAATGAIARSQSAYGKAWIAVISACVELAQGEPQEADRILHAARPAVVEEMGVDAGSVATIDFVHARALLDFGKHTEAVVAAERGLKYAAHHGIIDTTVHGLSACLALWDGDADSSRGPQALASIVLSHGPRLGRIFSAVLVRKLLLLKRVEEALEVAQRGQLQISGAADLTPGMYEHSELALARIELIGARGNYQKALSEIDLRMKIADHYGMRKEKVELHLLGVALLVQQGQGPQALRRLSQAIHLAARQNLLWPFHERADSIQTVIASSRAKDFGFTQPHELALFAKLQEWTGTRAVDVAKPAAEPLQVTLPSLTPREFQLLELLSLGLDNQQLADRATLSVPTVKWHLYNLYEKLAVKSRAAAIAKARTLRVL